LPRINPLDYDNLTPEQAEAVEGFKNGKIGAVRGPADAWLRAPGIADPARRLVEYCRYDTSLPREIIELVILMTGARWKAQVEFWGHAHMARRAGISDDVIEAIRTGETPPLERGDLRAAYELVSEYFATSRVSDGTYARALEFFGERGLVEIIGACGLYGMVSMTLNIFEARIPEGETDPFPE
jgi:4-carboxymuconolactone decarboxylase